MTVNLQCSGPGPHIPTNGIIGSGERDISGLRCSSPSCVPQPDTRDTNRQTIRDAAASALTGNRAFIASTPTNAQVVAQVKALSRQVNGLIRITLDELDGTD